MSNTTPISSPFKKIQTKSDNTTREGRRKYSGAGDWYPEIEEQIISSSSGLEDETIQNIPEEKIEAATFDQAGFYQQLDDIKDEASIVLNQMYPGQDVQVEYIGHEGRDLGTQQQYMESGASKASISLHQFNAAADYIITVDGVVQSGATPDSNKFYRTLGYVAREKGLFWGIPGDGGHVAKSRFVSDFIEEFPEQAHNVHGQEWYEKQTDNPSSKVRPTIEAFDAALGLNNPNRVYKEQGDRIYDELTEPIPPNDNIASSPETALDSLKLIDNSKIPSSPWSALSSSRK